MSAYGYPRLTSPRIDALAADGVLFERAFAHWPKTGSSMASVFIGQYPQTTRITHKASVKLPDGYLTLPEFFQLNGFRTLAVVSNLVLSARLGWSSGFDEYVETWGDGPPPEEPEALRRLISARRVNELALPLIEKHAAAERLFVWLHYSDPHSPYILPEGFENMFLGDAYYKGDELVDPEVLLDDRNGIGEHRELKFYVAQYDANIRVVDQAVQEVVDQSSSLGFDDSLFVLSSDHGEGLGERDQYFRHGPLAYNATSHVPLIFYSPGTLDVKRRVAEPVEMVDLFPTLRELVDPEREVPGLEGDSLLPWLTGEGPRREEDAEPALAFTQAGETHPIQTHFRSVQDERWKLVYHPAYDHKGELVPALYELYDLAADPLETRNLAEAQPAELRRMRAELFAWMNGDWILARRNSPEEKSAEALAALRALGYVE